MQTHCMIDESFLLAQRRLQSGVHFHLDLRLCLCFGRTGTRGNTLRLSESRAYSLERDKVQDTVSAPLTTIM